MIAEILSRLAWMGLTGAVVILAVLLLRILLLGAPKIFSYVLWIVVLFRLLCPFAPESDLSMVLRDVKHPQEMQTNGQVLNRNKAVNNVVSFVTKEAEKGTIFSAKEPEEKSSAQSDRQPGFISKNIDTVLFFIWITGMAAMLFYAVFSEIRLRKFLHNAVCEGENIYVINGMDTPFALGIFSPKIYLPAGLSDEEREYMLLHEQTHIRRRDLLIRRISFLALTIHWYHPLVWCAFFLSGRDMEMSCDEAVVKRLGNGIKQAYSKSLLGISAKKDPGVRLPVAFAGCDTGKRIRHILQYRKTKKGIVAFSVLVLLTAMVTLTTNPKRDMAYGMAESQTSPADTQETQTGADRFHEDANVQETDAFGEAMVQVRSISKSARGIDSMEAKETVVHALGETPAFADDCEFYINYSSEKYFPEPVDFREFSDMIGSWGHELLKPCQITYADGLVHKITLLGSRIPYGVCYEPFPYSDSEESAYEQLDKLYGKDALKKYFTLVSTEELDVADCAGTEIIEVYAGNAGDGDSGIVLVKDSGGNLLYSEWAHAARAGWNNIYAGKADGGGEGFLMTLHLENRDVWGIYSYQVFRIGADGGKINQLAGASFIWDSTLYQYDEQQFYQYFCHDLEHHLEDGHLLLSTQEGMLRTNGGSDSEIYCYRTLSPGCYEELYKAIGVK